MHLNLPILDQLFACKSLLIAGMGGGFDIFCGLPIYFELCQRGQTVHLANLSFSNVAFSNAANLNHVVRLTDTLSGVGWKTEDLHVYFPELYLAQWFKEKKECEIPIWCFKKTGVQPLLKNYRLLIEHLAIDGILLIDGGIDSLVRGNEAEMGTVTEDAVSLLAVSELTEVSTKLIGCLGFGAERGVTHTHILENIAALAKAGGFLGTCSLVQQMPCYQDYEDALLYVQSKPEQEPSVINSSILSSVRGEYGNYHLTERTQGGQLWISPLMAMYWFFDLSIVAKHNLFLAQLLDTETLADVMRAMLNVMQTRPRRSPDSMPLP